MGKKEQDREIQQAWELLKVLITGKAKDFRSTEDYSDVLDVAFELAREYNLRVATILEAAQETAAKGAS